MAQSVEFILKEDLHPIGFAGDVVKVKPGYARNYLLPRNLVLPVNPENLARVERIRAKAKAQAAERDQAQSELLARLTDASVTISAKAQENGHLYGSVGAAEIAKALSDEGIPVEAGQVRLSDPYKEVGTYEVPVHAAAGQEDKIVKVWVVAE